MFIGVLTKIQLRSLISLSVRVVNMKLEAAAVSLGLA